ncbi:MAG TPA: hypothetical protein VK742_08305 [Candidatus Sulfotelmatobacter sp.]|jgi:hypothetical protein|nr:hypothetical protein [Candidatus Sulfotelmatobacter sp.]
MDKFTTFPGPLCWQCRVSPQLNPTVGLCAGCVAVKYPDPLRTELEAAFFPVTITRLDRRYGRQFDAGVLEICKNILPEFETA